MTAEIGRRTQGRDWRRAGRAFTTLVRDQQRTDAVFDLLDSLEQKDDAEVVRRFSARPEGRRLLEERPNLVSALNAREALRRLPEASLGRAYLDFVEANEISALGLVAADEEREERDVRGGESEIQYLRERGRDCHDLWHVLTGYGTDEAGEISVLAFSCGQFHNLGLKLIVVAGAIIGHQSWDFSWQRYVWSCYQRGKRADLDCARYEEWLELPLVEARRRAAIEPPEVAHPAGIIAGGPSHDGVDGPVARASD